MFVIVTVWIYHEKNKQSAKIVKRIEKKKKRQLREDERSCQCLSLQRKEVPRISIYDKIKTLETETEVKCSFNTSALLWSLEFILISYWFLKWLEYLNHGLLGYG